MGKQKLITKLLTGIPYSYKQKIYREYDSLLNLHGCSGRQLNSDKKRELLSEAIFKVENDTEHKFGEIVSVREMNNARNCLYDDIKFND